MPQPHRESAEDGPGRGSAVSGRPHAADQRRKKLPPIRQAGPGRPTGAGAQRPGLVVLKIDGLAYSQAQRALSRGRLPHLARLIERGSHRLAPFYSGMPSTTPAVQGELFYGVKSSVPAIAYFDRRVKMTVNLLFPVFAGQLARRLASGGRALLEGGTAYSNIYSGGAKAARYCIETMRIRSLRQLVSVVKLVGFLLVQPLKPLRMLGYALIEVGLSLTDFAKGVVAGKDLFKELKFVPTRVLICAVIRELIRLRVKMDLADGVPIIHASFLGYDEQAHRRGPDSAFAHWSLKGIDDAIADIHRAARRSERRRYRLVVYSDHGQEKTISFRKRYGRSLEEAVSAAVAGALADGPSAAAARVHPVGRRYQSRTHRTAGRRQPSSTNRHGPADRIRVVALGPIGHVYLPRSPTDFAKARLAQMLVRDGGIPLVLYAAGTRVVAVNRNGRFDPVQSAEAILGREHAFAARTAEDLVRVCRHADAGDLVLSGWSPESAPLTFAEENGAHGGPGKEETRGLVLMPTDSPMTAQAPRPMDLRRWISDHRDGGATRRFAAGP